MYFWLYQGRVHPYHSTDALNCYVGTTGTVDP